MNDIKKMKNKKAVDEFVDVVMNLPLAECYKAKVINAVSDLIKKIGEKSTDEE